MYQTVSSDVYIDSFERVNIMGDGTDGWRVEKVKGKSMGRIMSTI